MKNKILSIGIPTYNRAFKLQNMLELLYSEFLLLPEEDRGDIDFYVSDNCSTDNTKEVILSSKIFKENIIQCRYFRNEKNLGMLGNIEKAYSIAKGNYVWILGDDDRLLQNIVRNVYLECKKEVFSYIFINHTISKDGNILKKSVIEGIDSSSTNKEALLDLYFKSGTVMMLLTACIFKNTLLKHYITNHRLNLASPCAISFYCASKGKTKFIEEPLLINDWTVISWKKSFFQVFYVQMPMILLRMPFWGYDFFRCNARAFHLIVSGIIKKIKGLK